VRRSILFVTLLASLWIVLSAALANAPPVRADPGILYVAPGGDDHNDCCSPDRPCSTIQRAVDMALPGDTVHIAAGDYHGVVERDGITQVVHITKSITLLGGYSPADWQVRNPVAYPSVVDAQGQGRGIAVTGPIKVVLDGLAVTGGDATGLGGGFMDYDVGGGIYLDGADSLILDCHIHDNHAPSRGGGIYQRYGVWVMRDNTITGNAAHDGGGATGWHCTSELSGNAFHANEAQFGGGLQLRYGDNTLRGNSITSNTVGFVAGGLQLVYGEATLDANLLAGNDAGSEAGAIDLFEGTFTLVNNAIIDNVAGSLASGVWIRRGVNHLEHNTIARNRGGDGSGIHVSHWKDMASTVFLTNTIVASHTVGIHIADGATVSVQGILWDPATPVTLSYSSASTVTVGGQVTGDPAFSPDGYHLTHRSAALTQGADSSVAQDIDGEPRPEPPGSRPDLGADEIGRLQLCLPLVMRTP
jgi:hypothetical protein